MAVPGPVTSAQSAGCHQLIRDRGRLRHQHRRHPHPPGHRHRHQPRITVRGTGGLTSRPVTPQCAAPAIPSRTDSPGPMQRSGTGPLRVHGRPLDQRPATKTPGSALPGAPDPGAVHQWRPGPAVSPLSRLASLRRCLGSRNRALAALTRGGPEIFPRPRPGPWGTGFAGALFSLAAGKHLGRPGHPVAGPLRPRRGHLTAGKGTAVPGPPPGRPALPVTAPGRNP